MNILTVRVKRKKGHAPRERVSWNYNFVKFSFISVRHAPRERVSWNNNFIVKSYKYSSHAPRERVSWNEYSDNKGKTEKVTLHVSVWVEMRFWGRIN